MSLPQLSNDQWIEIIQYLGADDFKSLRLAGNKSMGLYDPKLTSHLQLRMDRAPFFCENNIEFTEDFIRKWLTNRRTLVINDANATMSPSRVAYLVANGFCDHVTELLVYDCHHHGAIIEILSRLPNLKALVLIDDGDEIEAVEKLENIVFNVGNMASLEMLDISFNTVIHGSRLSFLQGLQRLQHLRLVGFNLSEGITFMGNLRSLETLHLTHGNFFSAPDEDVNEKDLNELIKLINVKSVKLEGFDCMTGAGLAPFGATGSIQELVLKHCQDASEECLIPIGRMASLKALHFVNSSCDDIDVFEKESLQQLNTLSAMKTLSLFHVLGDTDDLRALPGLTALQTLNIAFDDMMDTEELENLCTTALQVFPSLRKLRIFSEEDSMEQDGFRYGSLDVEYKTFNFGDLVCLE